ncbi:pyridoxal-phosphate dependent enzyme [Caenimonas sedimenti]|uniref:Pyridoxal-phosphate dependent enzyme n=1 Tax=Caenimonas sedimenti TaxID=2596921 RepID=A0A562ZF02_9BURK|nr:pyridoxal-phosphate dependent enzyme [Caenimonas sedimenti]TWO66025.1 pyridoxal-phosphate dependent enzyme [Caenimonas sedimenti]
MAFPGPADVDPTHSSSWHWNPALEGLRCLACGSLYEVTLRHDGCPKCATGGRFVSLAASYTRPSETGISLPILGIQQHSQAQARVLPALAEALGVARVTVQDESGNPTGSHKDRMSAFGVAHALLAGAGTVVLASSGNAAISAATYARAAGLRCEVAAYADMPPAFVRALDEQGATRLAFADNQARWAHVAHRAGDSGVLPLTNSHLPALGSAPLAIEGYKTIAAEMGAWDSLPDHILVPTARGDLLWGIWRGLSELKASGGIDTMPRLWAVEPFPRLSRVLQGAGLHELHPGQSAQFSTAGATTTWLQHQAVTASGGGAVAIDDGTARRARVSWRSAGIEPELCAAATLAAARQLVAEGRIARSARVCLVLTAGAARDPAWPDASDTPSLFHPIHGVPA